MFARRRRDYSLPKTRVSFARVLGRPKRELRRQPNYLPLRVKVRWLPSLAGWSGSFLFHAALFVLIAAAVVMQAAYFHVEPGQTSLELIAAPVTIVPPSPAPETPVALPSTPALPPVELPTPPVPTFEAAALPEVTKLSEKPSATGFVVTASAPAVRSHPAKSPAKARAHASRPATRSTQGAVLAQPDDLHNQPPVYPEESRVAREQGVVMLRVAVSATGRPLKIGIRKSSGYFHLDQAARKAVRDWRFQPASRAGVPIRSDIDVPVRFELK